MVQELARMVEERARMAAREAEEVVGRRIVRGRWVVWEVGVVVAGR